MRKKLLLLPWILLGTAPLLFFNNCAPARPSASTAESEKWGTSDLNNEDYYNDFKALENPPRNEGHLVPDPAFTGTRPNILFIVSDDQQIGMTGYENPTAPWSHVTPNIDSLGHQGLFFSRAYVPIGQCGPSRAAMWTGMMPHQNGVDVNGAALSPYLKTMPDYFHEANYYTGFVGKCHLGVLAQMDDYKRGFDYFKWADNITEDLAHPVIYDTPMVVDNSITYPTDITTLLTDKAIEFLGRVPANKNFFLWLAHRVPHPGITSNIDTLEPYYPPGALRINLSSLPSVPAINPALAYDPTLGGADILATAAPQTRASPSRRMYHQHGAAKVRLEMHSGLEHVGHMDENIGRVFEKLQNLGKLSNTLIVFISDNGKFYGDRGLVRKGPLGFEEIVRVPLFIKGPGVAGTGTVSAIVSSMDLMPTVLEMAGYKIETTTPIPARSFAPLLRGQTTTHRKSMLMEYTFQGTDGGSFSLPYRTVVRGLLKFIHYSASTYWQTNISNTSGVAYDGHYFELYDMAVDPLEKTNLLPRGTNTNLLASTAVLDSPLSEKVRAVLQTMALWQTNTLDPFRVTISNIAWSRTATNQLLLTWNTDVATWSEVLVRNAACATCATNDYRIETGATEATTTHSITLGAANAKEIVILSYTRNGQAGYSRIFTPAIGSTTPPVVAPTIELE